MSKRADRMVEEFKSLEWQDTYDNDFMRFGRVIKSVKQQLEGCNYRWDFAIKYFKENNCKSVIDVGCQMGSFQQKCINEGIFEVTGMDISKLAIKRAKEEVPKAKFIVGDITKKTNMKQKYDAVTAFQVIEHMEDPKETVNKLYGMLNPGGLLICTVPIEKALDDRLHIQYFDFYKYMHLFEHLTKDFKIYKIHKFKNKNIKKNLFALVLKKPEVK